MSDNYMLMLHVIIYHSYSVWLFKCVVCVCVCGSNDDEERKFLHVPGHHNA